MRRGLARLRRELGTLPRETTIALLVAIVIAVAGGPIVGLTLDHHVPVWVLVVAVGLALAAGIVRGASGEGSSGAYETYSLHVRDALADLRKVLSGELANFSLREFIETGIFEPAHVLLQRDHAGDPRGDVRFSILHPTADGADFVMANDDGLFPAHGHRAESRERFRLPIAGSFSGVAFQTGKVQSSNHLGADERFSRHPRAQSGREYESIVSVPLWRAGKPDGVLNVIATRKNAFSTADRTYITLLAAVIDVARTVAALHPEDAPDLGEATNREGHADDVHEH